jgi:prepilin-type N-terminal cleavage/methylation domain-containing protein
MKKGFTLIELLIVVAIIAILAAIAVPNFLEAQVRSKVSRANADMRSLATALESYYIDSNNYPSVDSSLEVGSSGFGANSGLRNASDNILYMPTFRRKANEFDQLQTLTSPIAYITSYFRDPFADTAGATFLYSVPANPQATGWIMWSWGPDGDERGSADVVVVNFGSENPRIDTEYYNPIRQVPSPLLIDATYDPTNGTTSDGDIFRYKQ